MTWRIFVVCRTICLIGVVLVVAAFGAGETVVNSSTEEWTLIRSYLGILDPAEGVVRAKVFSKSAVVPLSLEPTLLQNRIEVTGRQGPVQFLWPASTEFSGSICDVLDLDANGSKEFVIAGTSYARVVSYKQGKFEYRDRRGVGGDEIGSLGDLDILDIDGDGTVEFVAAEYPNFNAMQRKDPPQLVISQWSKAAGFSRVDDRLVDLYRKKYGTNGR